MIGRMVASSSHECVDAKSHMKSWPLLKKSSSARSTSYHGFSVIPRHRWVWRRFLKRACSIISIQLSRLDPNLRGPVFAGEGGFAKAPSWKGNASGHQLWAGFLQRHTCSPGIQRRLQSSSKGNFLIPGCKWGFNNRNIKAYWKPELGG